MTHSGTLAFLPPSDFAAVEIEGITRYWLRIRRAGGSGQEALSAISGVNYPRIQNILCNAVRIQNIKTEPEEAFYIDTPAPDMVFHLESGNLLHALVYVNETNSLSREAMDEYIREYPHKVKVNRNNQGEITRFFVLWDEVLNFNESRAADRHYVLDRTNNCLLFGNGLHGKIPSERVLEAFTVTLCFCNGEKGNVPCETIDRFESSHLFIGDVKNPVKTYGGCNMETLSAALKRGASLINSRNRLVSGEDYIREAMAFSDRIDQVSCIADKKRLLLVVLLKDFEKGPDSFYHLKEALKQRLAGHSEVTLKPGEIDIREPVYVKIHVEAWVCVNKEEKVFEVQDRLLEAVQAFLHPVSRHGSPGFAIGTLPKEKQIAIMLHSIKNAGVIKHLLVTADYEDEMGIHETGLDEIPVSPYMIGMNGVHKIHMEY